MEKDVYFSESSQVQSVNQEILMIFPQSLCKDQNVIIHEIILLLYRISSGNWHRVKVQKMHTSPLPSLGQQSPKKQMQWNRCCFQYLWEKQNYPLKEFFFVTSRTCEKIEVKRGHLVKKWEFDQTKKNFIYQFFKTRICAFMTYSQFLPKSCSNLRFVVRDSRVRGRCAAASNPWILDDKWWI